MCTNIHYFGCYGFKLKKVHLELYGTLLYDKLP